MASVDPRRTQPFCTPDCDRRCCCTRWPLYQNRFGVYVCGEEPEPAAWSPADPLPVSGLYPEHWYRSDQGLWQDAGITPAVNDGDVVGRWEDITANNDHVNQAAAGNKPTLQNGAGDLLNGHPVVRGDGIDDYLQGAFTTGGALAQPFMVFAVAKLDAAVVNDDVVNKIFDGDDVVNRMVTGTGTAPAPDDWRMYAGVALTDSDANADWNIWGCLFNGAASQLWHNGTSIAGPGNAGAHNPDGLTILNDYFPSAPWKGDITELLIYDANLSNADKNTVGQYLATRYGLAYTDI